MKVYLVLTAVLSVILVLLPLSLAGLKKDGDTTDSSTTYSYVTQKSEEETEVKPAESSKTINVLRTSGSEIDTMSVRDYLIGAVASEISPIYEKEAIKAQVVACYTYAKWLIENADRTQLGTADISDSSNTHQGYYDKKQLKEKWGEKYESYLKKVESCVDSVAGTYMTFDGEPIIACYHSLSSGKTESASIVWKRDIEYLKSVSSPGDKLSPDFDSTVTLSTEEFKEKCKSLNGVTLSKDPSKWVGKTKKSDAGFVQSIQIGSKSFDGNEIRSVFSLKSPYFTLKYESGKFIFNVTGYGHGLGMSQYSADYMARQGSTYKQILEHFYSGIKFERESI